MQAWYYGKGLIYLTANISANKLKIQQRKADCTVGINVNIFSNISSGTA